MWLLNTETLRLQIFNPSSVPDYVILSHRWNAQGFEECSFQDMTKTSISDPNCPIRQKKGFSKVQGACRLAARDGYTWIWIDSCCIDKSSSAELQEAVNSMWSYYSNANVCYVYMADVQNSEAGWDQHFRNSEWYTRGWTLQELIAPVYVEFYARDWAPIGTKNERHVEIADITKIDMTVLVRTQEIDGFSAAERLSWAAHRRVTREEDQAYSLLGLFEVNIPLLYGEGRERAFIRLQEAIYNSTADHTLFLFRHSLHENDQPLLADSPARFCDRPNCVNCMLSQSQSKIFGCLPANIHYTNIITSDRWATEAHEQIMTTITPLRNEMSTILPLLEYQEVSNKIVVLNMPESHVGVTHVAVLNHSLGENRGGALCLLLTRGAGREVFHRVRCSPVLLPSILELESRLQKTKVLICPGASSSAPPDRVVTTFSVDDDSFCVQKWSAKGSQQSILPMKGNNTALKVETTKLEALGDLGEISCRGLSPQKANLKISLKFDILNSVWSIKEVAQIIKSKRSRKLHSLFRSSQLADRCSFKVSDGKRFSVGLRRLSAVCRTARRDFPRYRYQIVVKHLSKECSSNSVV